MFPTKYPAFYALLALVAAAVKDGVQVATGGGSLLQDVLALENLAPLLMQLYPVAGQIAAEAKAMSAADIEAAAEQLVTDLEFTSTKAQLVISKAFPLAETLASLVPQAQALVVAIQS